MTRTGYLVGYAAIVLAALSCDLMARRTGRGATLPYVLHAVLHRYPARLVVLAGWLWLGWHLFARAHH